MHRSLKNGVIGFGILAAVATNARAEVEPVFLGEGGIGYHFSVGDLIIDEQAREREGITILADKITLARSSRFRPFCIAGTPKIPIFHGMGVMVVVPQVKSDWMGIIDSREPTDIYTVNLQVKKEGGTDWFAITAQDHNLRWIADHGSGQNFYRGDFDQSEVNLRNISQSEGSPYAVTFWGRVEGNETIQVSYCFLTPGSAMEISGISVLTFPVLD